MPLLDNREPQKGRVTNVEVTAVVQGEDTKDLDKMTIVRMDGVDKKETLWRRTQ